MATLEFQDLRSLTMVEKVKASISRDLETDAEREQRLVIGHLKESLKSVAIDALY
ncbi:hypothetical protein J6590_049716 [Homalodisca vitripennis]|nr:hypothetical protein J6590_049716 [Homalodisca vitripennis]